MDSCKERIRKYIDNDLSETEMQLFNEHLSDCTICRGHIESYNLFKRIVTGLKCPDSLVLFQFYNNELADELKKKINKHLEICSKCKHEYDEICAWLDNQESLLAEYEEKKQSISNEMPQKLIDWIKENIKPKAKILFFDEARFTPYYSKSELALAADDTQKKLGIWPLSITFKDEQMLIEIEFDVRGDYLYAKLVNAKGIEAERIALKYNDVEIVLGNKLQKLIKEDDMGLTVKTIDEVRRVFADKFKMMVLK